VDCGSRGISVAEGFDDVVEQAGDAFVGEGDDVDPSCEDDGGCCEAVLDCRDGNFCSF